MTEHAVLIVGEGQSQDRLGVDLAAVVEIGELLSGQHGAQLL